MRFHALFDEGRNAVSLSLEVFVTALESEKKLRAWVIQCDAQTRTLGIAVRKQEGQT